MSVEKTTADEAKSSLPVRNLDTRAGQGDREEARHAEVDLADCKNADDGTCAGDLGPERGISEHTIPELGSNEIRSWFQGLDADERSVVASFADGAFLSSFLAFAAPSSSVEDGTVDQQSRSGGEY